MHFKFVLEGYLHKKRGPSELILARVSSALSPFNGIMFRELTRYMSDGRACTSYAVQIAKEIPVALFTACDTPYAQGALSPNFRWILSRQLIVGVPRDMTEAYASSSRRRSGGYRLTSSSDEDAQVQPATHLRWTHSAEAEYLAYSRPSSSHYWSRIRIFHRASLQRSPGSPSIKRRSYSSLLVLRSPCIPHRTPHRARRDVVHPPGAPILSLDQQHNRYHRIESIPPGILFRTFVNSLSGNVVMWHPYRERYTLRSSHWWHDASRYPQPCRKDKSSPPCMIYPAPGTGSGLRSIRCGNKPKSCPLHRRSCWRWHTSAVSLACTSSPRPSFSSKRSTIPSRASCRQRSHGPLRRSTSLLLLGRRFLPCWHCGHCSRRQRGWVEALCTMYRRLVTRTPGLLCTRLRSLPTVVFSQTFQSASWTPLRAATPLMLTSAGSAKLCYHYHVWMFQTSLWYLLLNISTSGIEHCVLYRPAWLRVYSCEYFPNCFVHLHTDLWMLHRQISIILGIKLLLWCS